MNDLESIIYVTKNMHGTLIPTMNPTDLNANECNQTQDCYDKMNEFEQAPPAPSHTIREMPKSLHIRPL